MHTTKINIPQRQSNFLTIPLDNNWIRQFNFHLWESQRTGHKHGKMLHFLSSNYEIASQWCIGDFLLSTVPINHTSSITSHLWYQVSQISEIAPTALKQPVQTYIPTITQVHTTSAPCYVPCLSCTIHILYTTVFKISLRDASIMRLGCTSTAITFWS